MIQQLLIGELLLAAGEGGGGSSIFMFAPMIIIFVLFWMMLIRPEKRKQAEHQQMLSQLKKNDYVVTAGGIFGHVMSVSQDNDEVVLRIDENNNTRIKVRRSSISQVLTGKTDLEKV